MKIREIYKKYSVPPNLQEHMLRVASVTKFITEHWVGVNLDKDKLVKASLLHDLGNIVKFNFDKYPHFLGAEAKNIEFWKNKQKEIISKYGDDDHKATQKMLSEIGLDESSVESISAKSFANSVETLKSSNWSLKILLYSDMRVLPNGICSLQERLDDIMDRMPQYYNRPDINNLLESVKMIEKQIQENVNIPLGDINEKNVEINDEELLDVEI